VPLLCEEIVSKPKVPVKVFCPTALPVSLSDERDAIRLSSEFRPYVVQLLESQSAFLGVSRTHFFPSDVPFPSLQFSLFVPSPLNGFSCFMSPPCSYRFGLFLARLLRTPPSPTVPCRYYPRKSDSSNRLASFNSVAETFSTWS